MTAPKVPPPSKNPQFKRYYESVGAPVRERAEAFLKSSRQTFTREQAINMMTAFALEPVQAPAPPSTAPLTIEPHEFLGAAWALHYMGAFSEEWKANHSAVDVAEIIAKNFKLRGAPSTAEPPRCCNDPDIVPIGECYRSHERAHCGRHLSYCRTGSMRSMDAHQRERAWSRSAPRSKVNSERVTPANRALKRQRRR
jgi:hypothetical protein